MSRQAISSSVSLLGESILQVRWQDIEQSRLVAAAGLCRRFLSETRAGRDRRQAVIAFVARVLVKGAVDARHLVLATPRPRPGCGVVDGELVADRIRARQGEALGHL